MTIEELREEWLDIYAQTEVFLNERSELDPLGDAFVHWAGANAVFDKALALIAALTTKVEELTAEVERLEDENQSLARSVYDG